MNANKLLVFIFFSLLITSCIDDSYNNIKNSVIFEKNYTTQSKNIPIISENITFDAVQTNGLSLYQLGQYSSDFGQENAAILAQVSNSQLQYFGEKTAQQEEDNNERETIVSAKLHIPLFSTPHQKTENQQLKTTYTLDSIYGSSSSNFTIDVAESTYFLNDISENLQDKKIYTNNFDINAHKGRSLAHIESFSVSSEPVSQFYLDNPQTENDESSQVEKVLPPRLIVNLDSAFFQEKILEKEGSSELLSLEEFQKYFKGIIIETSNFSDDFLAVLNLSEAYIELVYSYEKTVNDSPLRLKKRINLPLSGIFVNKLSYSQDSFFSNATINLQGGKRIAKIAALSEETIDELKQKKAIITDAWLSFEVSDDNNGKLPERLLLFNFETGNVLLDYTSDMITSNNSLHSHLTHSLLYNKETNSYKVRITQHLSNIIQNEGSNPDLGLIIASDIHQITPIVFSNSSYPNGKVPQTMALTPLSVKLKNTAVLHISYATLL